MNQGTYRDDLYFRLAQTRLLLPSLAERREDIRLRTLADARSFY